MAAAFALVRALRGRRGPVAAAMALGRRGPLLLMRRTFASGNGAGGTGAGAGGGVVANSGGCGGATEVDRLRKETFDETRRLWDGHHKLCEADRKLFEELARLETENALNIVNAKVDHVSATFKVMGCAVLLFIGGAASMGPYIKCCVVHDTANQVDERLRLRTTKGEEVADKTAAPGDAQ